MNSLKTIYFPVTDIYSIRQFPLFLLFQNIHLIQPVEKSPDINTDSLEYSFINSDFCHVHTPCPLGEDRERFLYLIDEIKNRKDDYSSQLSSLTLAEMSRSTSTDGESERDLVKAISTSHANHEKSKPRDKKEETLWNSRLVLSIAEILDREQEEIARGLALLEDEESELFQSLHGDDSPEEDSPFAELTQLEKNLGSASSRSERKRTKAWKTIFRECNTDDFEVMLTSSQDSANFVLEKYEAESDVQPLHLANLELPGLIGWNSEEGLQAVTSFSVTHNELLTQISDVFRTAVETHSPSQEQVGESNISDLAQEWQTALEGSYPRAQYGRNKVTIYILPGFPTTTLLDQIQPAETKQVNGILILVD